jgi:hypothetical protein
MMDVEGVAGVVEIMLCAIWVNVSVRADLVIVMITGMMVVRRTSAQTRTTALTVQRIVEIILYATINSAVVRMVMRTVMESGVMVVR